MMHPLTETEPDFCRKAFYLMDKDTGLTSPDAFNLIGRIKKKDD